MNNVVVLIIDCLATAGSFLHPCNMSTMLLLLWKREDGWESKGGLDGTSRNS